MIIELNKENFAANVAEGVTLVDFWATWCGPCRMQGAVLDDIAPAVGDKAKICKVNVDENQDLAIEFRVMSIPALFLFKDGKVVREFVGLTGGDEIKAAIDAAQ